MRLIQSIKRSIGRTLANWAGYGVTVNVTAGGGRHTHPNEYGISNAFLGRSFQEFHNRDLADVNSWDHKSVIKIIRQISPEASLAITTFLRMIDSGYTITCTKRNGEPHAQAKSILELWINILEADQIDRFNMPHKIRDLALKFALDGLLKGAADAELVLDNKLQPVEPVYVDPWSVDFFWSEDETRWVPRQTQIGGEIGLDIPTFVHVPVDPLGNDPYGEEQITSAIRPIIFKVMVLQDLKQVVHANGWPRLDFEILEEAIFKNVPPILRGDETKMRDFIQAQLSSVIEAYKNLAPDDNIVHTDSIKVGKLEGGTSGNKTFAAEALLGAIDDQITSGLKTFGVMLSKTFGGGTEGYTSAQMILYVKLIGGFQRIVEDVLERIFTMALRFKGIIAKVEVDLAKPELRSELEVAQYVAAALKNVSVAYDEQAIGEKERRERIREILGFKGPIPDDISKERVTHNEPNKPQRPIDAEPDKESKRKETNRKRRSGTGQ